MSSDHDAALWRAYTKDVTPLGQRPVASQPPVIRLPLQAVPCDHTLDLHGSTLAEAHARTLDFITTAHYRYRYVTIITGLSGAIRREFRHWIDGSPTVRRIDELGGSYRVYFRRR